MGLADDLGIDPEDMHWKDWAACRDMSWDFFFTSSNQDPEEENKPGYEDPAIAQSVDQLCFSCPVQKACGQYGMNNRLEGVWGGVYLDQRGKVDKKRNTHKTAADWKKLREMFDGLHK